MTDGLKYRMDKSIALLRKAEHLAKMYDPEDGFYLAFSGGKDSQALYHIAQMAGVKFKRENQCRLCFNKHKNFAYCASCYVSEYSII